jgi:uncharacterized UBP type Zn finger protein
MERARDSSVWFANGEPREKQMDTEIELIELFAKTKNLRCPGCGGHSWSYLYNDYKMSWDTVEVVVCESTIEVAVIDTETEARVSQDFRFKCQDCGTHLHEWNGLVNQDFGDLWEVTNRPANVENIICAALEMTGTPHHLE